MSQKKKSPHDPLTTHAMKGDLAALKRKLAEEEAAKAAAAKDDGKNKPEAKRPKPAPPPKRPSGGVEVWRPEDLDQRLFEVAMSGVAPLAPKRAGTVPAAPEVKSRKGSREVDAKQRHAEGGAALTPRWDPDGAVRCARRGMEFALEALGRFVAPQDRLDLHGEDPAVVGLRVSEFVRTRRARGMRCVAVITGYGKNSPDGDSVLRDAAVAALAAPPASNELDAFATADAAHGGRGALLVALRA